MNPRSKSIVVENDRGEITTPKGFMTGAVRCGIKKNGDFDLGILFSEVPSKAAGVFTKNLIKSAPVLLSQKNLKNGVCQAVVVNSGCANACTSHGGLADAQEMMKLASQKIGVTANSVAIAATGVIGIRLPMEKIIKGFSSISLSKNGTENFARSIMTTDTFIKQFAVSVYSNGVKIYTIAGVAKGAGMIHPDMATMLCFITTDANIEIDFLKKSLKIAVGDSFNMITVDGDTSPSDTVIVMANGMAENRIINEKNGDIFQEALNRLCTHLAKDIAKDGEGATKLIEVIVEGANTKKDARITARTVANSPLVKTAMYGNDPNWGRIVVAMGRSGAKIIEGKIDLYLNDVCVMKNGDPLIFDLKALSLSLADTNKSISIRSNLNIGKAKAIAWGCDLTKEYVTINSAYTT